MDVVRSATCAAELSWAETISDSTAPPARLAVPPARAESPSEPSHRRRDLLGGAESVIDVLRKRVAETGFSRCDDRSEVLLHELPSRLVMEFVAAVKNQITETAGHPKLRVISFGDGGQQFARLAMVEIVLAPRLNFQSSRADECSQIGIPKEGETVLELEIAGDGKLVALVASLLNAVVTTGNRN